MYQAFHMLKLYTMLLEDNGMIIRHWSNDTNHPTPRSTAREQLTGSPLGKNFSTFYGRRNDTTEKTKV